MLLTTGICLYSLPQPNWYEPRIDFQLHGTVSYCSSKDGLVHCRRRDGKTVGIQTCIHAVSRMIKRLKPTATFSVGVNLELAIIILIWF